MERVREKKRKDRRTEKGETRRKCVIGHGEHSHWRVYTEKDNTTHSDLAMA